MASAACSGAAVPATRQDTAGAAVGDVIEWQDSIRLEETPDVINVSPHVNLDPLGGFIVADRREAQVRFYSPSGSLAGHVGRRGKGPGEFERPVAAVRLTSNEILAADMSGRITLFDSSGRNVVRTQRVPLSPVYDLAVANDSLVVFTGRIVGAETTPLVHLWNVRTGEIVRSFFQPLPPFPELAAAYAFTGFADVAVRGDTVAVGFALSDTLRFYNLQGRELKRSAIPFRGFRPLREPMPPSDQQEGIARWVETFSSLAQIHWTAQGTLLIQYFDMAGHEPQWRLVGLRGDGTKLFELLESPRLLAVTPDTSLVFANPSHDELNSWLVGRLRS
jgi:WD40 repeat protein